jgi:hypothetical protein
VSISSGLAKSIEFIIVKIIHILNHFLPQQTAGTEIYVWALCKHLQELNYNVSVLIPNIVRRDLHGEFNGFSSKPYTGDTQLWMRIAYKYPM